MQTSFTAPDAKAKFEEFGFDVILTDMRLPDYDGIQLLTEIKEKNSNTQVILMTGYAEVASAVKAMKNGAYDYISKPFTPDEIVMVIESALNVKSGQNKEHNKLVSNSTSDNSAKREKDNSGSIITGVSEASRTLEEYIKLVAPTNMSVLITGESGTGKEVTAKAIHDNSARKDFKFVAVDCGAIPKELAASEFFGHIKGSFTGAVEDKIGILRLPTGERFFLTRSVTFLMTIKCTFYGLYKKEKLKELAATTKSKSIYES